MDDIKTSDSKSNYKETLNESDEKIDISLFDDTLKQIEKTLKNLGEKIEPEQRLLTNKNLYKEKTNSSNEEHVIDNTNTRALQRVMPCCSNFTSNRVEYAQCSCHYQGCSFR